MPVFKIYHKTIYQYNQPVRESMNEVRIFPFQCPEQEVLQQNLLITGNPFIFQYTDYWGNTVGDFNFYAQHRELVIENRLMIRTTNAPDFNPENGLGFEALNQEVSGNLRLVELARPEAVNAVEEMQQMVASLSPDHKDIASVVLQSARFVYDNFQYVKGITSVTTTLDEVLSHRKGVCQDFSHVLLQILRMQGIPCRYVSGYICPNQNGMRGEGATHAWVEAYVPSLGWAGIDPTNNVWVTNKHVKLAVGRNFTDCTPVKGTFKGVADQKLTVYVSVGYEDGNTSEEMNEVGTGKELVPLHAGPIQPAQQ